MKSVITGGVVAVLFAFAAPHASIAQDQPAPAVQGAAVELFPSPMMAFNQERAPVRILYDMTVAVPEDPQVVEARVVLDDAVGPAVRRYVVRCAEEVRGRDRRRTTQVREFSAAASEPAVFRVRRDSELTFSLAAVEYEDGSRWTRPR
jgi:hypothetical protein